MGWVSCEECTGRHCEEGRLPQQSYLRSVEMLVSSEWNDGSIDQFLSTLRPGTRFHTIGGQETLRSEYEHVQGFSRLMSLNVLYIVAVPSEPRCIFHVASFQGPAQPSRKLGGAWE